MRIRSQKEGPEGEEVALVAHQRPPEVTQQGEGSLNFPALFVPFANFHRKPTLRKREQISRAAPLLASAGGAGTIFYGA